MTRKPIFDLVRAMLSRKFRQAEVDLLDQALDTAIAYAGTAPADCIKPVMTPPHRTALRPRSVSARGIALIRQFEGCARLRKDGMVEAYPDPGTGAAPWTIGWGATGAGIQRGTLWTQAQCDDRLLEDITRHAIDVDRAIGDTPTTQAQFDALVSFHYNTGAIHRATLTRKHCSGDADGAAAEFTRWNRAGGRVMRGLILRRNAEAELYALNEQHLAILATSASQ